MRGNAWQRLNEKGNKVKEFSVLSKTQKVALYSIRGVAQNN